jgi:hypothetical protein
VRSKRLWRIQIKRRNFFIQVIVVEGPKREGKEREKGVKQWINHSSASHEKKKKLKK